MMQRLFMLTRVLLRFLALPFMLLGAAVGAAIFGLAIGYTITGVGMSVE